MAMLFNIARAEVYLNGAKTTTKVDYGTFVGTGRDLSLLLSILSWASALLALVGVLLLIIAFFLYIVASGDELKMAKSHNVLLGGIACLVGTLVCYLFTRYFS